MAVSTQVRSEYRFQHAGGRSIAVVKRDESRYRVTVASGMPVACTCPSFHYRGACKHLGMVAATVEHRSIGALALETIACANCRASVLVGAAHVWRTVTGLRFICADCLDDLLLHVHEEV